MSNPVVRVIVSVVLGYVAMAAAVFVFLTAGYLALGVEGTFQPGSYGVKPAWLVVWFVVGLGAAILGGWVCAKLSDRSGDSPSKAPYYLVGLVLFLGILQAVGQFLSAPTNDERKADTPVMEAMMEARQPAWVLWATPLIGVVGVLVGSRLCSASKPKPPGGLGDIN